MADVIARQREARRKRILENSEVRLKKLLGESVKLHTEVDSSNRTSAATTPPSSPLSVSSDSWTKNEKQNDADADADAKGDDETVPALSARHLLRDISEEMDFRYDDLSSARIEDVAVLASRIQQKESSVERLQRTSNSTEEIVERQSVKSVPATSNLVASNYWFAQPKIRRGFYVVLALIVYLIHTVDFVLHLIGKSIIFPFIFAEVGIVSYELFFVRQKLVFAMSTAHSLLNGALMLSGVPESIIIKISTVVSYVARIWEEFSIFFFTFLFLHWFVIEVVFTRT